VVSGQQASAVFSATPRTRLPGSGFPTCAILFSTVRRKLIVNRRPRLRVPSPNARVRVRERLEGNNFSQDLNHHKAPAFTVTEIGGSTATQLSSTIGYKVFTIALTLRYLVRKMVRLITHNLLACHVRGCTSNNFPLVFKDVQLELREAEFNADFLRGFMPKLDWKALVDTAKSVGLSLKWRLLR
jgi:hypothetical protein